jgi:hypothetical protein
MSGGVVTAPQQTATDVQADMQTAGGSGVVDPAQESPLTAAIEASQWSRADIELIVQFVGALSGFAILWAILRGGE